MKTPDQQLDELFAATSAMRHAQKEYFRTRSPSALNDSKSAERAVDRVLKEIDEERRGGGQLNLFEQ